MHKIIPLLCLLAAATLTTAFGPAWYQCSDATCTGNCHCGSDNPPGGLAPADTPQFVLITHDDAVTGLADHGVRSVTDVHSNTNGCNIPATWFVTQEGSDCSIVQRLFADNHEIALHTVHHYALVPDLPGMEQEIMGVKNYLNATCGIPNEAMVGFRSPYLVTNWVVRGILEQNGFLYDSSIDEYVGPDSPTTQSFGERLWPYTMDFGIAQDCNWTVPSGMCQSTEKYPGLWEIPMWDLPNATVDTENNAYTMDPGPGYGGDVYTTFQTNFDQAYNGNRAPFPIYVHAPWFTPENINATNRFIEYALSKPDVFFVTMQQLINWIKNPVPASQVGATLKCNPVNLTAPTTPSCQVYTVQPGDYIDLIASKFGILNSTDISALNPGSNNLQPGDLLKIPPWNATCGNGIPSNGTEGAAASYGSFSETLPTTPPGPITPATTNPMALPPPEAPTQAQPAPVAETQPAPVAETQPAPVAETQPAPAGQYAANRVEMMMNLAGMDPATFQANTQTQFAIALAQQLKVAPETIALGSGSRRRHRSLLQAQPTTLQVLVVVTTSDPVGVAQQAQRQIENGDFESMLTSLGLTPQGAPTVTAYENNVSVPVPPPTATAPAPPSSSKGLSTGAIVGIAVGGAVALIAIVAVGVVVVRKRRAAKVAQLGNPKLKYIGGEAKLAVKTESQKGANDPFAVVKGGVETPTSPTQRTYFSSV